jgi:hypothetical protein
MAAIALLPLRVANAHLHLCLDGKEVPVSVHLQDAPTHFDGNASVDGHDDRDIAVPAAQAHVKLDTLDAVTLAFIAQSLTLIPASPPAILDAPDDNPPSLPSAFDLRPPSRGPPR